MVERSVPPRGSGSTPSLPLQPYYGKWPFHIIRCENKKLRSVAKEFVNKHHSYIRWADRPSRKLYWLLYKEAEVVGVFGLCSAFARPKLIKEYMEKHYLGFNEVANNSIYCLIKCDDRNAGSRFLAISRRDAQRWWADRYGDLLKAFQCFVLPPRTGAVYKADNWIQLGKTTTGKTLVTRTLYGADIKKHPEAERRVFKSGEVKYLLRKFETTTPKLIFVKLA